MTFETYFAMITNGLCVGFGAAAGSWLANTHLIKRIEKINRHLSKKISFRTKTARQHRDRKTAKQLSSQRKQNHKKKAV